MSKNANLYLFGILALALLGLVWLHTGKLIPPSGNDAIWFHAGLFMLLLGRFIVEYRFTKPSDVFVNCVTIFVSISTLANPPNSEWWQALRWGSACVGALALFLAWDPGREAKLSESPIRSTLYFLVTRIGRAEVIFSLVFILALLSYFDLQSAETRIFVVAWGAFLLAAQLRLGRAGRMALRGRGKHPDILGVAHSFLAPSILYFRRLPGRRPQLHEVVGITDKPGETCNTFGLLIGERASANETRFVVAMLGKGLDEAEITERTLLVSTTPEQLAEAEPAITKDELDALSRVVGTVAQKTNISQLRVEVFGKPEMAAGRILSVRTSAQHVYYQVFDGLIDEEVAVNDSSRAFVEGHAEQIGVWDSQRGGFETHDWVAPEKAPVFMVDYDEAPPPYTLKPSEIGLGHLPQSSYPVNADLDDLILHHAGILGVTGSGKSYLTYQLIECIAQKRIKVICVDPTGDYQKHLTNAVLLDRENALRDFLASDSHFIGLIETANSPKSPIVQTRMVAQGCLDWCKANRTHEEVLTPRPKVLVVLEEAHLLVPEWNFNPDKSMQDEVSRTSQIVLQARKYGLGFLVVAQRTANVVKSVLNQCNTVVSFQAFDETGFEFLKNYMGAFHVKSLPNLRARHAILVGKASRSRRPVMVRFPDQDRVLRTSPAPSMPAPQ